MDKRILVIPHSTQPTVRCRLREIGFALSKYYHVYILNWFEPKDESFIKKAKASLRDIFKKQKVYEKEGITFAGFPILHRPLFMIKSYNSYSLEKFLIKQNIDILINGMHYFFFSPKSKRYKYKHIFDLNDLPSEEIDLPQERFSYNFAKREIEKADTVTACSKGLVDYIQEKFHRKAHLIPNGTYLDEFSSIDYDGVRKIRMRYNLLEKFVLGYIGNVGNWIDLDFLISFFRVLKNKYNDLALLVVGGGQKVDYYKDRIKDEDIVFTGGISYDKITPYFFAIDLGLLPSKKSLFQDLAFHIKLIEYTAAKKMVISSPLEEVKRLSFPNIFIADLRIEDWMEAIDKIRQSRWDPVWDDLVNDYDWRKIGEKFISLIEGL